MRSDIVGAITPGVEITETPAFRGSSRCLFVEDAFGNLHGRIEWLADEVDAAFLDALTAFAANVFKGLPQPRGA